MSNQAGQSDSLSIIVTKLVAVFLGFIILVLVLVAVGYLGNAYFTAQRESESLELIKQEAFVRREPPEEYLRRELAAERMTEEMFHKYMQLLEEDRKSRQEAPGAAQAAVQPPSPGEAESAQPRSLPTIPESKILPPPNLSLSGQDLERISGKAALIHTTLGTIVVELYAEVAPRVVANFVYLAEKDFYDGLYFHRTQPNSYVQGGSPTGVRGWSAGYWISPDNSNLFPYIGTIGALPYQEGETEIGSEFVIFCRDASEYHGMCTVFGRVIDRFDVVEKITDTRWDMNGYAFERTYITNVEIVDVETVRPEEDFWENFGKE